MKALEELVALSRRPSNSHVMDYKKQNRKVIGFFCSYVPEEIIYAGGMLPYRIRPAGCAQTTSADVYMSRLNCTFARSCLEFMSGGVFDFLDGIVFANSCDNIRRLYDISREKRPYPFMHFMSIPHKAGSVGAMNWYKEEVTHFAKTLEGFFGIEISEEALHEAISVYNETRGLLRELYELRQAVDPPITGAECLSVVLAATTTPKDRYNKLLRKLLEELKEREGLSDYRARLMIVGSEYDDPEFTGLIEDLGGLVVVDALCYGSRYFWEPVKTGPNPMDGLVRSTLARPSCPRMSDGVIERVDFIRGMTERFKVDGVILQQIRYCDLWGGEATYLRKALKESNLPVLQLEREYWLSGIGQLKTRIQAFLETIERG